MAVGQRDTVVQEHAYICKLDMQFHRQFSLRPLASAET